MSTNSNILFDSLEKCSLITKIKKEIPLLCRGFRNYATVFCVVIVIAWSSWVTELQQFSGKKSNNSKMSEHDEVIGQFKDVTGVEDERARFYLESAGWKLDVSN